MRYWCGSLRRRFERCADDAIETNLLPGVNRLTTKSSVTTVERSLLGDVMIALGAYTAIALVAWDRYWPRCLTMRRVAGFLFIGLAVTVALEWLATRVLDRWQYGADMPTVPVMGTSLAPVLQWIVIPLASIVTLRRVWYHQRSTTARWH